MAYQGDDGDRIARRMVQIFKEQAQGGQFLGGCDPCKQCMQMHTRDSCGGEARFRLDETAMRDRLDLAEASVKSIVAKLAKMKAAKTPDDAASMKVKRVAKAVGGVGVGGAKEKAKRAAKAVGGVGVGGAKEKAERAAKAVGGVGVGGAKEKAAKAAGHPKRRAAKGSWQAFVTEHIRRREPGVTPQEAMKEAAKRWRARKA